MHVCNITEGLPHQCPGGQPTSRPTKWVSAEGVCAQQGCTGSINGLIGFRATHTRCEAHHLCQLRQQGGTITNTTNSNKHSMHTCTHKPRRAGNTCDLQIHSACAMQQCKNNSSAMQAARAVLVDTASSRRVLLSHTNTRARERIARCNRTHSTRTAHAGRSFVQVNQCTA